MKYYPNDGDYCYICSLANLLVKSGDADMAGKVFDSYREHPLVLSDGAMVPVLATRLVSDLTEGRYKGLLKGRNITKLDDATKRLYNGRLRQVKRIMGEELDAGRVIPITDLPNVRPFMYAIAGRYYGHWIVDAGDGIFIDDGEEVKVPLDQLRIMATLEVRKV